MTNEDIEIQHDLIEFCESILVKLQEIAGGDRKMTVIFLNNLIVNALLNDNLCFTCFTQTLIVTLQNAEHMNSDQDEVHFDALFGELENVTHH